MVMKGVTEADALRLTSEHHPDVLLLGLNTVNSQRASNRVLPACDTIRHLVINGQTGVLVLSRHTHKGLVRSVLNAGASGFMAKDEAMESCAVLAQTIMDIARRRKRLLSATFRALDTPNANGAMIECLRLELVRISR